MRLNTETTGHTEDFWGGCFFSVRSVVSVLDSFCSGA